MWLRTREICMEWPKVLSKEVSKSMQREAGDTTGSVGSEESSTQRHYHPACDTTRETPVMDGHQVTLESITLESVVNIWQLQSQWQINTIVSANKQLPSLFTLFPNFLQHWVLGEAIGILWETEKRRWKRLRQREGGNPTPSKHGPSVHRAVWAGGEEGASTSVEDILHVDSILWLKVTRKWFVYRRMTKISWVPSEVPIERAPWEWL